MANFILVAAYGRRYMTKAEAIRDLENGLDFIIRAMPHQGGGKYCSIRDFPGCTLEIRYGKINEHAFLYKVPEKND